MTRRFLMAAVLSSLLGCNTGQIVPRQEATVGCGLCRFQIPGSASCYWAIELDGKRMPVVGAHTPGHEDHGPDGMCVMDRRAVVAGRVKRDQFLADTFELIPADGVDPAAAPAAHEHAGHDH
ncbi:MAG: hypothetical protein KTR31_20690 [Myxococcales bacterium]|nr:hypothetical protein [Myxococcales bacterium]